ncbi:MAG: hypothetical protein IJU66_09000 [Oscillospiraceae bacterium]|nr:hypothetical protein [Oscillospiraceae bacterium]
MQGVLNSISGFFSMIGGYLQIVKDFLDPFLKVADGIFSVIAELLSRSSALVFLIGFYGLLLAFLWFLFSYLDKKRLTLPVVVFTLAFFVFLSGNLLMISQEQKSGEESSVQAETVDANAQTPSDGTGDAAV